SPGETIDEDKGESLAYRFEIEAPAPTDIVLFFSVSGDALPGVDYLLSGATTFDDSEGTVVIPAGLTSAKITVSPIDDAAGELTESVVLSLKNTLGYALGEPSMETQWIRSDEHGGDFGDAPAPYP